MAISDSLLSQGFFWLHGTEQPLAGVSVCAAHKGFGECSASLRSLTAIALGRAHSTGNGA